MRRIAILGLWVILLGGSFLLGYLTHRNELIPKALRGWVNASTRDFLQTKEDGSLNTSKGEWYPFVPPNREGLRTDYLSPESAEAKAALEALGYSAASEVAPEASDVTVFDADAAYAGLNLYSSGHAAEAYLMNMEGEVLHTWGRSFYDIWPDYSPPEHMRETGDRNWRRVHVFENGDLLAIHEGIGLIKLDRKSNLLWARRNGAHHDFQVADDGRIYVLTREAKILPRINPESLVLEPLLDILAADGTPLSRVSILECFERSPYAPILAELPEAGDLFHTNTIEVFDGTHADTSPLFKKGNVMISIWSLNAVAILDLEAEMVVWVSTGMWRHQHQPTLLDSGNMLIFDNQGPGAQSQVIEFAPFTQEVLWTYRGSDEEPFYTEFCGASHRLPNGNTLITESNNGRAFEVTPEKEIVWEFINPHRVTQDEMTMIGMLWEVIRLAPDFGSSWVSRDLKPTSR